VNWYTELYVIKLKLGMRYSKSLEFDRMKDFLEIRSYDKSYDDYIKPNLLYFTESLNGLATELDVIKVHPMGLYIRGVYGGEGKKGEEEYAGLVLKEHQLTNIVFNFQLYNIKDALTVPLELLEKYGVKIYKMIYLGEVNPFRVNRYLNIILSRYGETSLKEFLQEALKLNERKTSIDDHKKVKKLISELQQPDIITTLSMDKYYVVYRRDRIFTASTFRPTADDFIVKDEVGYIECTNELTAHYYTAALNYLAFKVLESRRPFIRHQYARPLFAIYIAGLSWRDIDNETRRRLAELSKSLHERAPRKEYANQRVALKDITQFPEFRELIRILDSKTDGKRIEKALDMVSSSARPNP
jgi:hypothetical protein